jgi:hypothetical protein
MQPAIAIRMPGSPAPMTTRPQAIRAVAYPTLPPRLSQRDVHNKRLLGLFFDRLFSPLNCVHTANHEGRKIALHNFFFACFFAAEHLPRNLSLSLLRSLFILWTYFGDRAVEWKNKTAKEH